MNDVTPQDIRHSLLAGDEIALINVREEADFALGHPLFAAQVPLRRIDVEARWRIPRLETPVVVYDDGEGLAADAVARLEALGYGNVRRLAGGGSRDGARRAMNCSRTSTAIPRRLANWSSIIATRRRSRRKTCRRSSASGRTSRSSMRVATTNTIR